MTPKEKAEDLLHRYDVLQTYIEGFNLENAKQCALIAVDEVMKQCWEYRDIDLQKSFDYWNEIKTEIEKL